MLPATLVSETETPIDATDAAQSSAPTALRAPEVDASELTPANTDEARAAQEARELATEAADESVDDVAASESSRATPAASDAPPHAGRGGTAQTLPSGAPVAEPSAPTRAQKSVPPPLSPPPAMANATPSAATNSSPTAPTGTGFGRWLMVLAAGLLAVISIGYRVLHGESTSEPSEVAVTPSPALAKESSPAVPSATTSTPEPVSEPSVVQPAAPAESALPAAPAAAQAAPADGVGTTTPAADNSSTPRSAASAVSAEPAPATPAAGTYRVTLTSTPPQVQFFRFGKRVGVTPFVLELPNGERRAYEAGLPGYVTRKVVVDGSKNEIKVSLRPE